MLNVMSLPGWAEPHLEPGVGDMRVFEREKLGAEWTLVAVDGLINLQEENTNEEDSAQ